MNLNESNKSSGMTATRVIGVLLIASGIFLNGAVVGWLFAPDKSIGSSVVLQTILLYQGVLVAVGILTLIVPAFFSRQVMLLKFLTGVIWFSAL